LASSPNPVSPNIPAVPASWCSAVVSVATSAASKSRKLVADRQAKARAAEAARGTVVRLLERVEDRVEPRDRF